MFDEEQQKKDFLKFLDCFKLIKINYNQSLLLRQSTTIITDKLITTENLSIMGHRKIDQTTTTTEASTQIKPQQQQHLIHQQQLCQIKIQMNFHFLLMRQKLIYHQVHLKKNSAFIFCWLLNFVLFMLPVSNN